ncbi:MAG TPA: CPBP family intramembrane glutamic endopeptidase [Thermoanaerobaculia bacterium]|nr:CPBP family intramembrane glutamic endopeptidase [Thermoanaerobaculia bacterium]
MVYAAPILILTGYVILIILDQRRGLLGGADHFPTVAHRYAAYAWLGFFLFGMSTMVTLSALHPTQAGELRNVSFPSLFVLHYVLLIFLVGWWLLTGRPELTRFLNLRRDPNGESELLGFAVGFGGWVVTIAAALAIGLILKAAGLIGDDLKASPMIPWMAALPIWKKIVLVFAAMTIEEFFYRAWLQKRVGLLLSTILFAISHAGYGQPIMLIGIALVSLIIGFTFYKTKNLVPCIIAHGVFDSIQLFVILPVAIKFLPT